MKEYYYVEGTDKKGPFSLEQLKNARISSGTLVWTKGMPEWQRADSIDELNEILQEMPQKQTTIEEKQDNSQDSTATSPNKNSTFDEYIRTHAKPDSYLVWGILATIFCCLPLGIISIVYASKVEGAYFSQQYDTSLKYSSLARRWSIVAFILGLVIIILYIILIFTTDNLYRNSYNSPFFYNQGYF